MNSQIFQSNFKTMTAKFRLWKTCSPTFTQGNDTESLTRLM